MVTLIVDTVNKHLNITAENFRNEYDYEMQEPSATNGTTTKSDYLMEDNLYKFKCLLPGGGGNIHIWVPVHCTALITTAPPKVISNKNYGSSSSTTVEGVVSQRPVHSVGSGLTMLDSATNESNNSNTSGSVTQLGGTSSAVTLPGTTPGIFGRIPGV